MNLPTPTILNYAIQIAKGIECLHINGIVHRDMKSPNIILKEVNSSIRCIVSDFGLSGPPIAPNVPENNFVDNPVWTAVEVLKGNHFVFKSDVYSYSIILWELQASSSPFAGTKFMSGLMKDIIAGTRPAIQKREDLNEAYYDIMVKCWDEDISKRYDMTNIVSILESMKSV